jgi:hypothetical protein
MVQIDGARAINLGLKVEHFQTSFSSISIRLSIVQENNAKNKSIFLTFP